MKIFFRKLRLALAAVLTVSCCSCAQLEPQVDSRTAVKADDTGMKITEPERVEAKPEPVEPKPVPLERRPDEQPVEPSEVVAEIDGQVITRGELQTRLMRENRGEPDFDRAAEEFVDAETVLLKMLGEKAMIIEGRKGNLLEESSTLRELYEQQMVQMLFTRELSDKVNVTESEIDAKVKSNPKLDRARARSMLQATKRRQLAAQFFDELSEKLNLKKLRYNFPKVAKAHQRLLYRPQSERSRVFWIQHSQMDNELTEEEKNTPLATYDGGQVTLMDWFERLNMIPPLKRPKDLGTVEGVERLLDGSLEMPVFVAEARRRGLDKDPNFLKQIAPREERIIFSEARTKVFAGLSDPTEEEMLDYFNKNKEKFRTDDTLEIDQIWCVDLQTAQKARSELDGGRDFASVKKEYSLKKDEKAFKTTASREGAFFKDLWAAEPNDIVGPVRGFYQEQFRWRLVRILEKKPGRMQKYEKVSRKVKSRIRQERRKAKLAEYQKELLAKYPYKIHREKIKDLDPLNIP